jgi:hypothetical protein
VQHCSTISFGGVHLFNIHLHSIVCPHRSITMFKRLNPDTDVLQVHHHSYLLLEFTRSWLSLNNIAPWCDLNVLVHWLSFFEPHCPPFTDSLFSHLSLPPRWSEYCLFFLFKVHCFPPCASIFQGMLRRVDVISCQGFRRLNQCSSLFDNLSYSRIKSHTSKVMSIQV